MGVLSFFTSLSFGYKLLVSGWLRPTSVGFPIVDAEFAEDPQEPLGNPPKDPEGRPKQLSRRGKVGPASLLGSMFPLGVYWHLACDLGEIKTAAHPFLEFLIAFITQKGNVLTAGGGGYS